MNAHMFCLHTMQLPLQPMWASMIPISWKWWEHTMCLVCHHRHICACPTIFNICISVPSEVLKHTFDKDASEPHQTMKYIICYWFGLRRCASSQRITLCLTFAQLECLFITYGLTYSRSLLSTLLHTCGLDHVLVAIICCSECCSPPRCLIPTA